VALRATGWAVATRFAAAWVSPAKVDAALDAALPPRTEPPGPQAIARLARLGALIDRVTPGRSTCFTRSVTIRAALVGAAVDARVRIGIARSEGQVRSHAWVEAAGVRFGYDPTFLPIDGEPA
jgi:hypothetical protein